MNSSDVVIAGAGIIGLAIALELATQGLSVTVLEQGAAMREASWAAAGMLAARDPENPPQLRPLAEFSRLVYPMFLRKVEELSGKRVPLRTSQTVQGLAPGPDAVLGLDAIDLHMLVPKIAAAGRAFIQIDESSLDPRDLCAALPLAAAAAGVQVREQTPVLRVEAAADQLRVTVGDGELLARHYIHCCGAWSAIPDIAGARIPVEPRKGQILTVLMPADSPRLDCVLRTPEVYLVPRGDGRIVVGATVEQAGFDRALTDIAAEWLFQTAAALWPPLELGMVAEHWCGFRPATSDSLPILGALSLPEQTASRAWIATGHYRNGILLAPATARVLRELVLGNQPPVDLAPFSPDRFRSL